MEKFNNTGILTGYIKQVLHNFNLPKYRVYTDENERYHEWALVNNNIPEAERPANWRQVPEENVLETITKNHQTSTVLVPHYDINMRYIPYIKDGYIQEYISGEWVRVGNNSININDDHIPVNNQHNHTYEYGKKVLNYTKNLKITNNVYDSYTHEYLGDYLRFQRDYNNINLMPLYNCFSNRACERLYLNVTNIFQAAEYARVVDQSKFTSIDAYINYYVIVDSQYTLVTQRNKYELGITPYTDNSDSDSSDDPTTAYEISKPEISTTFIFDTNDKTHKIYMVPVKLFKEYTIAIDSNAPIEFCCGLYDHYQDTREKFSSIPGLTYKKIAKSHFNQPFLYSELLNITPDSLNIAGGNAANKKLIELAQNEENLKLFIKLPINNDSTIVILEGNYLNWNDSLLKKPEVKSFIKINEFGDDAPIAPPELLDGSDSGSDGDSDDVPYTYLAIKEKAIYTYHEEQGWAFDHYLWPEEYTAKTIRKNETIINTLDQHDIIVDTANYYNAAPAGDEEALDYYINNYNNSLKQLRDQDAYFSTTLGILAFNIFGYLSYTKTLNNAVINLSELNNKDDIPLITTLQLLRANTKEQHPFADRLIEYLLGNAITSDDDEIPNNIKRAQKIMQLNSNSNGYIVDFPGIWDNRMKKISYDYMNRHTVNFEENHDLLGYIDKEVEKIYAYTTKLGTKKKISISISNAELEEGDFK